MIFKEENKVFVFKFKLKFKKFIVKIVREFLPIYESNRMN